MNFFDGSKTDPLSGNGTDVENGSWISITKGLGFDYNYNVSFTPQKLPAVLLSFKQKTPNACMVLSSIIATFACTGVYTYLCFTLRHEFLGILYPCPSLAHAFPRYEPRVAYETDLAKGRRRRLQPTYFTFPCQLTTLGLTNIYLLLASLEACSIWHQLRTLGPSCRSCHLIMIMVSRWIVWYSTSLSAMNMTTRKLLFCV